MFKGGKPHSLEMSLTSKVVTMKVLFCKFSTIWL